MGNKINYCQYKIIELKYSLYDLINEEIEIVENDKSNK